MTLSIVAPRASLSGDSDLEPALRVAGSRKTRPETPRQLSGRYFSRQKESADYLRLDQDLDSVRRVSTRAAFYDERPSRLAEHRSHRCNRQSTTRDSKRDDDGRCCSTALSSMKSAHARRLEQLTKMRVDVATTAATTRNEEYASCRIMVSLFFARSVTDPGRGNQQWPGPGSRTR